MMVNMMIVSDWTRSPPPRGSICPRVLFRPQRPSVRGGRPRRSHGDGTDIHGPQERREAREDITDHHQVRNRHTDVFRLVRLWAPVADFDHQLKLMMILSLLLYITIITYAGSPFGILITHIRAIDFVT